MICYFTFTIYSYVFCLFFVLFLESTIVPLNWTAKLAGCLATWNTGRCSDTDPRQSRGRIEIEWKVGRNKGRFL
ncbi:hypothetical protein T06_4571 [Trichinella sp. T6]|nr:hypothetical protein T06_4571 [Trichinella sp. T6]